MTKDLQEEVPTDKRPLGCPSVRWRANMGAEPRKMIISFDRELTEERVL